MSGMSVHPQAAAGPTQAAPCKAGWAFPAAYSFLLAPIAGMYDPDEYEARAIHVASLVLIGP